MSCFGYLQVLTMENERSNGPVGVIQLVEDVITR